MHSKMPFWICQQTSVLRKLVRAHVDNTSKNNKVIQNYLPCCFISIGKT
ncbi:unnamed protein product [Acanthoscelides obtectus]|uniref:Uncharacterized protein n=1 Tax=Acanthoscelides obtectus TaxID=200917 RepID=A0A9P0JZJ7_ACAOB|nr:unnamed protein product [Acanthoscelides obtectus]CAK1628041.1 hypothetical protein AOBTE_LOCUS4976 [Acanthoscelides obtectus]